MTLAARLAQAAADPELRRLGSGLRAVLRIEGAGEPIVLCLDDGAVASAPGAHADIILAAPAAAWETALASPPPPRFQAFTAFAMANPAFTLTGAPLLVAQARAVLERLFERALAAPPARALPAMRDMAQISGRYCPLLTADGPVTFMWRRPAAARPFCSCTRRGRTDGSITASLPIRTLPRAGG